MHTNRLFWLSIIPALLLQGIGAYVYFVVLADSAAASPVYGAIKVLLLVWPLLWLWLGAPIPRFQLAFNRQSLAMGVTMGVVMSSVIVALSLAIYGHLVPYANLLATKADDLFPLAYYMPIMLLFSIFHSLFEEYYWRWFVFSGLRQRMSDFWAMIVGSAAFTLHHIIILSQFFPISLTIVTSLGVFIGGCMWCAMYRKCNALAGSWISHAIVDATIFAVGYTLIF